MKCYNHHDRDAFGICKSCGKGLCLDCLKDTPGGIVCKDDAKCEESVAIANYSLDLMKKQTFSKKRKWLTFATGLALIVGGILSMLINDALMKAMGIGLFSIGTLYLLNSRSMGKNMKYRNESK